MWTSQNRETTVDTWWRYAAKNCHRKIVQQSEQLSVFVLYISCSTHWSAITTCWTIDFIISWLSDCVWCMHMHLYMHAPYKLTKQGLCWWTSSPQGVLKTCTWHHAGLLHVLDAVLQQESNMATLSPVLSNPWAEHNPLKLGNALWTFGDHPLALG